MQKGFTIIEILVVIAVMGVVGVIITEIFFNTLKGSSKANLISKIKQNGQSAMELMDKTIRNADAVVCINETSRNIVTVQKNGVYTRFVFKFPSTGNGYISMDNPSEFAPGRTCEIADVISTIPITDNTSIALDNIRPPEFTRSRQAGFKDAISISFSLKASQIDPIPFATTVQLR